jgi:hypothetical protein
MHSVLSLEAPTSASVGFTLLAAGHASGWPILGGGAQVLPDAFARYLEDLGGRIETGHEVRQLPEADLILADITPRQLLRITDFQLPSHTVGGWSASSTARAPSRLTSIECSYSLDCSLSALEPPRFTLAARLKRLPSRSEVSAPIGPLFFLVNRRSSTPAGGILPGPIAMYLTEAEKTVLN